MNDTWTLLVDLTTDRIVWFAPGKVNPADCEGAAVVTYYGLLPPGMVASNAFAHRYENQQIVPPTPPGDKKLSLLQQNRHTAKLQIEKLTGEARAPFIASNCVAQKIREYKLAEAHALLNGTLSSTLWLPIVAQQLKLGSLADAAREIVRRDRRCAEVLATSELIQFRYRAALDAATTSEAFYGLKQSCAEELKSIAN